MFKPAELVPASPWALADIIQRAGLPAGVLNLVMGPGSKLGPALASSPDIDAVSFTGSQDVGPSVAAAAVEAGARVQLEMGGKNPLIVLDDADLATAVSIAVNGAFFQAGQRCTASSRLIVTEGIHDRFVAAMIERMKTLVVDDALKPGTEIGPVVDERQLEKNLEYVEIGQKEGARLVYGGERLKRDDRRLLHGAGALHRDGGGDADQSRGNLRAGGVGHPRARLRGGAGGRQRDAVRPVGGHRDDVAQAREPLQAQLESGLVMVNLPTAGLDYHVPFGGRKKSSYGPREQGTYAKEFYTIVKTAYTRRRELGSSLLAQRARATRSARATTGASTMRSSRRNAPWPWARAAASASIRRCALATSSADGLKTSLIIAI